MSTRAIVTVQEDGETLVRFYHHSDGYPSWLGKELAEFVLSGQFVNGLSGGGLQFNGAGCFAAALIKHLKDGPGGVYIIPAKGKIDMGQEYDYVIDIVPGQANPDAVTVTISCKGAESTAPRSAKDFLAWAEATK